MSNKFEELGIPSEIYRQIEQIVANSMFFISVDDFVSFLLACYLAHLEESDLPGLQLDTVKSCK